MNLFKEKPNRLCNNFDRSVTFEQNHNAEFRKSNTNVCLYDNR